MLVLGLVSIFTFGVYVNLKRNLRQKKIIETQNLQIQDSLTEKETLLREIHHRVKNNLQIISSLLNIQSETITDKNVLSSIQEGQSRVQAMSLIHQNLYQSEHINNVDIENYLKELVDYLSQMFDAGAKKIEVNIDAAHLQFDIDTAIPLGLIVNELVSNAYKYAFESRSGGTIDIIIRSVASGFELQVNNNGNDLPEGFEIKNNKSLGLKLVTMLSRQLRGKFTFNSGNGTTSFIVLFKDSKGIPKTAQPYV
jgi:two-component system, sensor histidine kinase PdtaS